MKTSKKGISLIVLVITIIVMIILATAIILSLNSSNISGKASEAKLSSDLANKKEAASVFVSEYELKVAKGKIDKSQVTADAYVKAALQKSGVDITDVAVQEDGTILVGTAALFVNQEVPIGTKVDKYVITGEETYTTSGKENSYDKNARQETTTLQSVTLTRGEITEWKYFGIDENGNALIVGSVADNATKMILGGKGGFVYGPQELNNACKIMYSGTKGVARNIDIDDVLRVLEYKGEKGSYCVKVDPPTFMIDISTPRAKSINEIAKEIGYDMSNFGSDTPEDGNNIGQYKSDFYNISKTNDVSEYNSINANLIYPGDDETLTTTYWLSSPCVYARFIHEFAHFYVRYVHSSSVSGNIMCCSRGYTPEYGEYAIRPVVQLSPSVQITYENGVVTLK